MVSYFSLEREHIYVELPDAAGAAPLPAGAAPTPDPMLEIKFLTSTPSRALAKRLGQYGSTSTLAAFKSVAIFSPCKQKREEIIKNLKFQTYTRYRLLITYIMITNCR